MLHGATFPPVTCPGCNVPMRPVLTVSLSNNLHKIVYLCEKCGTETERIYKGDAAPVRK